MYFSCPRSVEIYQQERRGSCHILMFFALVSRMTAVFYVLYFYEQIIKTNFDQVD